METLLLEVDDQELVELVVINLDICEDVKSTEREELVDLAVGAEDVCALEKEELGQVSDWYVSLHYHTR